MDTFLATIFALLACVWIYRASRASDVLDFQLGVIAVFSIGYFCLPVWFKQLSPLRAFSEDVVAQVVLIFLLFALCVASGVYCGRRMLGRGRGLATPRLDKLLNRHRFRVSILALLFFLYYFFTQSITSYSAENFDAYFNNRGALSALLATVSDIAVGWIVLALALAWKEGRKAETSFGALSLVIMVGLLLTVGQRLAFLSPIVMFVAALALTGQIKRATRLLGVGVVCLLLVSPVAVAVRQAPPGASAVQTISSFNYGENPVETVFQSIIDRGDLLYVAASIKPAIEQQDLPGPIYYASVLVNPVPSFLMPGVEKPYLLSTNGEPGGELSIYAWRTLHSLDTGSLTAFGGLVAYRELSWAGVVLNGFVTGILFVVMYRWLGRGGLVPMVLYANLFVAFSVKKVPPSFWEALSALAPMLPFIILLLVVDKMLPPSLNRRAATPAWESAIGNKMA